MDSDFPGAEALSGDEILRRIECIFHSLPSGMRHIIAQPRVLLLLAGLKASTTDIPQKAFEFFERLGFRSLPPRAGEGFFIVYDPHRLKEAFMRNSLLSTEDGSWPPLRYGAPSVIAKQRSLMNGIMLSYPDSAVRSFQDRSTDIDAGKADDLKMSTYDGYGYYLPIEEDVSSREEDLARFFRWLKNHQRYRELIASCEFSDSYQKAVLAYLRLQEDPSAEVGDICGIEHQLLLEMGYKAE